MAKCHKSIDSGPIIDKERPLGEPFFDKIFLEDRGERNVRLFLEAIFEASSVVELN